MSLVERRARALGVWNEDNEVAPLLTRDWSVARVSGSYEISTVRLARRTIGLRRVDEPTALLWTHTLASGESFDVGRCGACVERGWEWGYANYSSTDKSGVDAHAYLVEQGWQFGAWEGYARAWVRAPMVRRHPCPTCTTDGKPTGRDVRTLARLMVEAMPKPAGPIVGRLAELAGKPGLRDVHGNPEARLHLATAADQLQLRGEPLGTWLALWLVGECARCHGQGWFDDSYMGSHYTPDCPDCNGTGLALGSGHGAMKRAALDAMRATTIDTAFGLAVQP